MVHTELYEALGCSPNASEDEIKKKYRKLAKQYHPDKCSDRKESDEKMKLINGAYSVLSDPEKRSLYDRGGIDAVRNSGNGFDQDFDGVDLFSMFFGQRGSRKGTTKMYVEITLEEMFTGCTKSHTMKISKKCTTCRGVGAKPEHINHCSACNGQGKNYSQRGNALVVQTCMVCRGQGKMIPKDKYCQMCRGSGSVQQPSNIEFTIPKGSVEGDHVLMEDAGEEDRSGKPTDLLIIFKAVSHDRFRRSKENLFMDVSISLSESVTGFSRVIKTISGINILLEVPMGEYTPHGSRRVIREHGMPIKNSFERYGSLTFIFAVTYPPVGSVSLSVLKEIEKLLPAKLTISAESAKKVTYEFMKESKSDSGKDDSRRSGERGRAHDEEDDGDDNDEHFTGSQTHQAACQHV